MNGHGPQWSALLQHLFGLRGSYPQWFLALIGLAAVYLGLVVPGAWFVSYVDRKLGADFQARVGPNRAGPSGFFQPLADFLKLLQKDAQEKITGGDLLWMVIFTSALYSSVAVIPLGASFIFVDTDLSAFIPFWSALILALGTMLLGFSRPTVPGWFGAIKVAGQAFSGAFPALVSLVTVGIRAGGFRWSRLVGSQGVFPAEWAAFSNPFQFLALLVFMISGLVMMSLPPMDGVISSYNMNGGVISHLFGRRWAIFRLGRFYAFFLWCLVGSALFLGGWQLPARVTEVLLDSVVLRQGVESILLLTKTFILMVVVIWVSRVNSRTRVDQVTDFAWKVLCPFALVALMGSALWAGWELIL
ncbi:complex I subunit 1 family protein [Bdellovibrionota bacterium FG-2]